LRFTKIYLRGTRATNEIYLNLLTGREINTGEENIDSPSSFRRLCSCNRCSFTDTVLCHGTISFLFSVPRYIITYVAHFISIHRNFAARIDVERIDFSVIRKIAAPAALSLKQQL
jgi:hypothetical protein